MATGLEIAAAITGILQVSTELYKLSNKYCRSFKRAPEEGIRLREQVSDFSYTLEAFCKTARQMVKQEVALAKDVKTESTVRRLRRMTKASVLEVRSAFIRLDILCNDRSSFIARVGARIYWVLGDERDLKELIANLNTAKLDISLLLTIFNTNIQLKIVEELRRASKPIPEDLVEELILLKRRYNDLKRRHKQAIRQQEALAGLSVAQSCRGPDGFRGLIQSFGQEVHVMQEQQMPEAQAVLEEIRQDHAYSSTNRTTTVGSTTTVELLESSQTSQIYGELSDDNIVNNGEKPEEPSDGNEIIEDSEPGEPEDRKYENGEEFEEYQHVQETRKEGDHGDDEDEKDGGEISSTFGGLVEAGEIPLLVVAEESEGIYLIPTPTTIKEAPFEVGNSEIGLERRSPEIHAVPMLEEERAPSLVEEEASRSKTSPVSEERRSPVPVPETSGSKERPRTLRRRHKIIKRDGHLVPEEWHEPMPISSFSGISEAWRRKQMRL